MCSGRALKPRDSRNGRTALTRDGGGGGKSPWRDSSACLKDVS